MFNLPFDETGSEVNVQVNIRDMGNGANSMNKSMVSCPKILSGMSHEMRTHMNSIVAFSFLMKEKVCNDSEREEFGNQILSSCEQLISLFDSFLDSAIIDTGNSIADSRLYNFDNLLDGLLSEFREILEKEDRKDLELINEIQFSNSSDVEIDKSRIMRIIRSLFQNSIKNTKSGYITIGYGYNDNKVTFYVLDSGQGYFKCKEFLQTEDMNESLSLYNDTYTAINITLAKKLIQMLEGTIWIECNGLTGSGTYFSVPAKLVANSNVNINKYINIAI
jgi:signal transduction histidine kinase